MKIDMITPEMWLKAYEHCKAGSRLTCEGCPFESGEGLTDDGIDMGCTVSLMHEASQIISSLISTNLALT